MNTPEKHTSENPPKHLVVLEISKETRTTFLWVAFWMAVGMAFFGEPQQVINGNDVTNSNFSTIVCPGRGEPTETSIMFGLVTVTKCVDR